MEQLSTFSILLILLVLIFVSGCFSASETAMMALNRYRLRHLANQKHSGAMKARALLERPDRLIGLVLVGNTFANYAVSTVAFILGLRLFTGSVYEDEALFFFGLFTATMLLIFSELVPKTVAAFYTERVAFPFAHLLQPLLRLSYPLIWLINAIANKILNVIGIRTDQTAEVPLSREELRAVVKEAGNIIPKTHQRMLFAILDLEKATVEDIMVPRHEITGIDLDASLADIIEQLTATRHTRVPVYRGLLDNIVGILHMRRLPRLLADDHKISIEEIERALEEAYYVPINTPLNKQLLNFQRERERLGVVVDEYGDLQGLVAIEDLLEEIVGEFTTDPLSYSKDIFPQPDGSFLVDGTANVREINRALKCRLPTRGARTLNGLILETLETIPEQGASLRIGAVTIEVVHVGEQSVKTARLSYDKHHVAPASAESSHDETHDS